MIRCEYCGEPIEPGEWVYKNDNDDLLQLNCLADYIEEHAEEYGFKKIRYTVDDDPWKGRNL